MTCVLTCGAFCFAGAVRRKMVEEWWWAGDLVIMMRGTCLLEYTPPVLVFPREPPRFLLPA